MREEIKAEHRVMFACVCVHSERNLNQVARKQKLMSSSSTDLSPLWWILMSVSREVAHSLVHELLSPEKS